MTDAGFKDVHIEQMTILWGISDKNQFEAFVVNNPLLNYQLDKQQLAKDLPNILETIFPNYKTEAMIQVRCTANIGYGFK